MALSAPPAPTPVASRRIRLGVLALLVLILSLSLVFTSGTNAQAYASAPSPVTIGTRVRTTPAGVGKAVGCAALRIVCTAFKAVNLAMVAYQTKDSWLPVLQDGLGQESSNDTGSGGSAGTCLSNLTSVSEGSVDANGSTGILVSGAHQSCSTSFQTTYVDVTNYSCMMPNGAVQTSLGPAIGAGMSTGATTPSNGSFEREVFPCGSVGGRVVQANVQIRKPQGATAGNSLSNITIYGGRLDASSWSQTTTVKCKRPDGTTLSVTDTEKGNLSRIAIPSCYERHGYDSVPDEVIIKGGPDGAERELTRWSESEADRDRYRNCFGPDGLQCSMQVFVDGSACTVGAAGCVDWEPLYTDQPNRVQCRFGSYVVGIGNCSPLKRSYKPDAKPRTITKVKPDGSPDTDGDLDAPTAPNPSVGPYPTAPPMPTTGPNPEGPRVKPTDPTVDTDSASCYGDAWGWNPVDWVMVPVKCALMWAFVPKTSLDVRIGRVKTQIAGRAPFGWVVGVGGLGPAIPGGVCPNWVVKVGDLRKNVVCDSSYTDAIRTARPVLLAFMAGLALWPLIRSTMYAAVPILKPSPSVLR